MDWEHVCDNPGQYQEHSSDTHPFKVFVQIVGGLQAALTMMAKTAIKRGMPVVDSWGAVIFWNFSVAFRTNHPYFFKLHGTQFSVADKYVGCQSKSNHEQNDDH